MYITPLRWSGGGNKKKFSLLPKEGPRLPSLAALGWIIAYYVEFGKRGRAAATPGVPLIRPLRGHLPPWVGKALGDGIPPPPSAVSPLLQGGLMSCTNRPPCERGLSAKLTEGFRF